MLPFTKRNARFEDDVDTLHVETSEIEVVRAEARRYAATLLPAAPSASSSRNGRGSGVRAMPRRPSPPAPPTSSFPADDFDADLELEEETHVFDEARVYDSPTRIVPEQAEAYARTMDHAAADPSLWRSRSQARVPFGIGDSDDDEEKTIARAVGTSSLPPPVVIDQPAGRRSSSAPVARVARVSHPASVERSRIEDQEHTAMMQVPAAIRARAVTMELPAYTGGPGAGAPKPAPLDPETRARVLAQLKAPLTRTHHAARARDG